jgi:hypothetical protein
MCPDGHKPLLSDSLHSICYKHAVKLTYDNFEMRLPFFFGRGGHHFQVKFVSQ